MKIAILGRSEMLYETARLLHENGHEIKVILTAKAGHEYRRDEDDFKMLARNYGVPFLYESHIGTEGSLDYIKKCGQIDIAVSVNYPNIIPQTVISLFRYGILNAHGGDLPKYRGNACQAWAIINGESKIGLCIHKMVGGELDSGDIIARDYFLVNNNCRIGKVVNWMNKRVPELFNDAINKLAKNLHYNLEVQSIDPLDVLRCYPRKPEDGKICWDKKAEDILRLINASSEPYAGAYCLLNEEKMIIWRASLVDENEAFLAIPGQVSAIIEDMGVVHVCCGVGKICLHSVQVGKQLDSPIRFVKSHRTRLT